MTDVRLTALNPEDSKVYPVACNSSGELLTTKGSDINLDVPGNITAGGDAVIGDWSNDKSVIIGQGTFNSRRDDSVGVINIYRGSVSDSNKKVEITSGGSATFKGDVIGGSGTPNAGANTGTLLSTEGMVIASRADANEDVWRGYNNVAIPTSFIKASGAATFEGDVVIGSRGAKWLIRESNGVAMLIEQTTRGAKEPRIGEEVRDLPRELDLVEAALSEIMGKLKMTPPAGWPVWDGD
jgi:hypothetical protein